ncbi:uncharacterized protein LOC119833048 [Zerene cesonia]|uniref:uncharacterized protein LOC119833048 n=1 Tax=Zerene cesonia TaxID=33412 RepID=UPI0018E50EEA|nr:uncharacterized protein LOC119833048 [Zerene cesonia]
MRLRSSASDQNVFFAYVCMVNDVKPIDDAVEHGHSSMQDDNDLTLIEDRPIQVERSKALHELVESHRHEEDSFLGATAAYEKISNGTSDLQGIDEEDVEDTRNHANILKLTKMKWLTEDQEGYAESSSPSISPSNSTTSTCSRESDDVIDRRLSFGDKCLSTILRLDREHNMFGMSNIAIVGKKTSKRSRKDEKPVFPQTAIVQICCGKGCCRHKSNSDLPASLKDDPPCPAVSAPCSPSKCMVDCANCFGLKISLKRKPKYEPSPIELTPRSSCVLQKPLAARSCHHIPHCVPPSSCFPYLMPCYWPARAGAPCNDPARCFHTPPCRAPRKRQGPKPPDEICPKVNILSHLVSHGKFT